MSSKISPAETDDLRTVVAKDLSTDHASFTLTYSEAQGVFNNIERILRDAGYSITRTDGKK